MGARRKNEDHLDHLAKCGGFWVIFMRRRMILLIVWENYMDFLARRGTFTGRGKPICDRLMVGSRPMVGRRKPLFTIETVVGAIRISCDQGVAEPMACLSHPT